VTTLNYSAIADLHTLQITTAHTKSSPACCDFSSRFLVTVSNSGDSSASAFTSLHAGSQLRRLSLLLTDSFTTLRSLFFFSVSLRLVVYRQSFRLGDKPLEVPSDERMGLSFTIAAGTRQRSHSRVRVPRYSLHFTVSDSRLPQPGGSGPHIYVYIPQKQGGPVMSPGTGFPFLRLLRLAGLWWRYSTPESLLQLSAL
jgi:hypothetical protein